MIRYANIIGDSIVDGPGIRVTVFLQGCLSNCEGCHNVELQDCTGGTLIDEKDLAELILSKVTPLHKGITFSGGEPLLQPESLLKVIMIIRKRNPKLDIWVYTGYYFENVTYLPVMVLIDVLVDGLFILAEKDLTLKFKGSTNQRIINVVKSLQQEKVVLEEV